MRKVPFALNLSDHQILQPQTSITPLASSASPSKFEISYSVRGGSPNRSRGSAGQMRMCVVSVTLPPSSLLSWWIWRPLIDPRQVCHLRPRAQNAGKTYPTCGLTCAAALKNTVPNSEGNASTLDLLTDSYQNLSLSYHSSGARTSTQTATTCVVCFLSLHVHPLQILSYYIGLSCETLSRWEICHMWDGMHSDVVQVGTL